MFDRRILTEDAGTIIRIAAFAAIVLFCLLPFRAFAQTDSTPSGQTATHPATSPSQASNPGAGAKAPTTLTGDWGGLRTQLSNEGIDISSGYKNEAVANVSGGPRQSSAQAGDLFLGVTLDTKKLFGWAGGTFQATMNYRQGQLLPVPLLQQPQEVFGRGDIARLIELWYEQKLFDDMVTFKFGRMPQGDFNNFGCEFTNLTFCGAPAGNIVGNYWYNWPISQWAAWGRVNVGDVDFRSGVYETNPRDLDLAFSPGWFCCATGAMLNAELGWSPKFGPDGLQGRYQGGVWYDTAGGPDVLADANGRPFVLTGLPAAQTSDRYGFYIQGVQQLTGTGVYNPDSGWKSTKGLALFVNFVAADRATSTLDNQFAAGVYYAGPFASRPDDTLGLAVGRTEYNSRAAEALQLANPGIAVPHAEYPLEVYYSVQVQPGFDVRPDFQYIVHPGGITHAPDVVVLGLRTDLKF